MSKRLLSTIFVLIFFVNISVFALEAKETVNKTDKSIFIISVAQGEIAYTLELFESGKLKLVSGIKELSTALDKSTGQKYYVYDKIKGYEIPKWIEVKNTGEIEISQADVKDFKTLAKEVSLIHTKDFVYSYTKPRYVSIKIDNNLLMFYESDNIENKIKTLCSKAFDKFNIMKQPYSLRPPYFVMYYNKPLATWKDKNYLYYSDNNLPYKSFYNIPIYTIFKDNFNGNSYIDYNLNSPLNDNQNKLTRGELITILGIGAGVDLKQYPDCRFTDVAKDMYYSPYIEWAAQKGIVSGTENNLFQPDNYLNREQACVILYNFANHLNIKFPTQPGTTYSDDSEISSWAKQPIYFLRKSVDFEFEKVSTNSNVFSPKSQDLKGFVVDVLEFIVYML